MKETNERKGIFTFKVGDKDISLLFSMNFWRLLGKQGVKIESLAEELDGSKGVVYMLETMAKILTAGGQCYAVKYKTEFEYAEDEIFDWFEEDINETVIKEMIETMMETKVFGNSLNQGVKRGEPGKTKSLNQ